MAVTSQATLMRDIGDALRLDNDNCEKEAYKKYVSCIYNITTNLILSIRSAGGDVVVNGQSSRQIKLAQQCVDRLAALSEKLDGSGSANVSSAESLDQGMCAKTTAPGAAPTTTTTQPPPRQSQSAPHQRPPQDTHNSTGAGGGESSNPPGSGWMSMTVPSLPIENNPHVVSVRSHSLTPMEKARRQNQSLMVAYKARMAHKNKNDFNAFSYSLTIQRKMAENLAIAQAQEIQLAKKIEARNQRLEEQAAKRFASAAPLGMSKEEQEQRQIYKRILQYENDAQWLQTWRYKVDSNRDDPIVISQLVAEILRCSDHPITELLRQYQFKIYQLLYPLLANKHQHVDRVKVPLDPELRPSQEEVVKMLKDSQVLPQLGESSHTRLKGRQSSHESDGAEGRRESGTVDDIQAECSRDDESGSLQKDTSSKSDSFSDPLGVGNFKSQEGEALANKEIFSYSKDDKQETNNPEIKVFVNNDHKESSDSDADGEEEVPLDQTADQVKEDLALAVTQGESLTTQLSWEHRQAQLLMRQVTKDYENYEIDNFDDLFDDDNDSNDDVSDDPPTNTVSPQHPITPTSGQALSGQALSGQALSGQALSGQALSGQALSGQASTGQVDSQRDTASQNVEHPEPGQTLYHSTSHPHQPGQEESSMTEEPPPAFQSLPVTLDPAHMEPSTQEEEKKVTQLSREAYGRHLKTICDDIHNYLEKLQVMLTIAYESLDTPVGREQCLVSLEEPFFKPIWKTLVKLFRVVNHQEELVLASIMTQFSDSSPRQLKVNPKFCLEGQGTPRTQPPYLPAVTELSRIQDHYTMISKLECIVKVCRLICECVDEYYREVSPERSKSPSLGADDLLPVLTYVIVQSALPQLVSECHAMTEFIHEGYLMGEEGYCLTTLRTALIYVTSLMVAKGQGSPS